MLKFVKHHMESIEGISIYPIISLLVFILFFVGLLIYTFRLDKSFIKAMKDQPLNEEELKVD